MRRPPALDKPRICVSVYLDEFTHDLMKEHVKSRGTNISSYVRLAINEQIERDEEKLIDQLERGKEVL